jgi:hypothetical protein
MGFQSLKTEINSTLIGAFCHLSKRALGCPCNSDNSIEKAKRVGSSFWEVSEIINIIDLGRLPVGTC